MSLPIEENVPLGDSDREDAVKGWEDTVTDAGPVPGIATTDDDHVGLIDSTTGARFFVPLGYLKEFVAPEEPEEPYVPNYDLNYNEYVEPMSMSFFNMEDYGTAEQLPSYDSRIQEESFGLMRSTPLNQILALSAIIEHEGPLSLWRFDDEAAPYVDYGSLANNVTGSATPQSVTGPDSLLYVESNGSGLSAPDNAGYTLNNTDGTTFVFNVLTDYSGGVVVEKDNEWRIEVDFGHVVATAYNTTGFTYVQSSTVGILTPDVWHTVVVVFPAGANVPIIYIDSITPVEVWSVDPDGTRAANSTSVVEVGGCGGIANVAIFNDELDSGQIEDIMVVAIRDGWTETLMSRTIRGLQPVGYWKLDDLGLTVRDHAAAANHGTADFSVIPHDVAGPDGNRYYKFDAPTTDCNYRGLVTIPHSDAYEPVGHGMTVVALMRSNDDLQYPIIYTSPDGDEVGASNWDINNDGNSWRTDIGGPSGSNNSTTVAEGSVIPNEWQLVVVRYPDMSVTDALVTYPARMNVNSPSALAVAENPGTDEFTNNPDGLLYFGGYPWYDCYGIDGGMAHVAIFDYEMGDAEVEQLYDAALEEGWISAYAPDLNNAIMSLAPASYWPLRDYFEPFEDRGYVGHTAAQASAPASDNLMSNSSFENSYSGVYINGSSWSMSTDNTAKLGSAGGGYVSKRLEVVNGGGDAELRIWLSGANASLGLWASYKVFVPTGSSLIGKRFLHWIAGAGGSNGPVLAAGVNTVNVNWSAGDVAAGIAAGGGSLGMQMCYIYGGTNATYVSGVDEAGAFCFVDNFVFRQTNSYTWVPHEGEPFYWNGSSWSLRYGSITEGAVLGDDGQYYVQFNGGGGELLVAGDAGYSPVPNNFVTVFGIINSPTNGSSSYPVQRKETGDTGQEWVVYNYYGDMMATNNSGYTYTTGTSLPGGQWSAFMAVFPKTRTTPIEAFTNYGTLGSVTPGSGTVSANTDGDIVIGSNMEDGASLAHVAVFDHALDQDDFDFLIAAAQRDGWFV